MYGPDEGQSLGAVKGEIQGAGGRACARTAGAQRLPAPGETAVRAHVWPQCPGLPPEGTADSVLSARC